MRAPPLLSRVALLSALLVAAGLPACKRKTGPSEHYDRGAAIHQRLYVTLLDDAYLDPRMEEAVKELKQVESSSISLPLAVELLGQIEKGRAEAKAAADARAKSQAEMQRGLAPSSLDPSKFVSAPPPPKLAAPDAGTAPLDPYGPGALIADINKETGGCLVSGGPFKEEGGKVSGLVYKLADTLSCKDKLAGFVGQLVLAIDGRIYRRVPATEARVTGGADAGTAAGTAAVAPVAAPPPPPPFPGARYRAEGGPAFEGQKDAPKPEETKGIKLQEPAATKTEDTKGVKLQESAATKMEESTPKPQ